MWYLYMHTYMSALLIRANFTSEVIYDFNRFRYFPKTSGSFTLPL